MILVTTEEAAFKSGAPFLSSGQCGAVIVFLSLTSRASLCEAVLVHQKVYEVITSFWSYAFVDYAAFHLTTNIYKMNLKLVLSVEIHHCKSK